MATVRLTGRTDEQDLWIPLRSRPGGRPRAHARRVRPAGSRGRRLVASRSHESWPGSIWRMWLLRSPNNPPDRPFTAEARALDRADGLREGADVRRTSIQPAATRLARA